jgi:hypothetical protein
MRRICVSCGSSPGNRPEDAAAAEEFGRENAYLTFQAGGDPFRLCLPRSYISAGFGLMKGSAKHTAAGVGKLCLTKISKLRIFSKLRFGSHLIGRLFEFTNGLADPTERCLTTVQTQ